MRKTGFLPLLLPGLLFENDDPFFLKQLNLLYFLKKIKMNERMLPPKTGGRADE
jgi:hypothetical protein